MICINCGTEGTNFLCDKCRSTVDIEELCYELIPYRADSGLNPSWDQILKSDPEAFKKYVFDLSKSFPTPKKEYIQILALSGGKHYIAKNYHDIFYKLYEKIEDDKRLTDGEKSRLEGLALNVYFTDIDYFRAEKIARNALYLHSKPIQLYLSLADFYTKTRRYDIAGKVISSGLLKFADDQDAVIQLRKYEEDNNQRKPGANNVKKEYIPQSIENQTKYLEFLASVGIRLTAQPVSERITAFRTAKENAPKPIPREKYPLTVETTDSNFNSFVAFSLETTGRKTKDKIIEIGAIKVVNGRIIETKEFVFKEFVFPIDSIVSPKITSFTGITNDDLKGARQIYQVLPDFMKFAGNSVLVNYNCIGYDCRFMVEAGCFSNVVIRNKYFDLAHYSDRFLIDLDLDPSNKYTLYFMAGVLGFSHPLLHRALDDAVLTAKVFLKLKEMEKNK